MHWKLLFELNLKSIKKFTKELKNQLINKKAAKHAFLDTFALFQNISSF